MTTGLTYAVGDVHGCIDELRDLLNTLSYRAGTDRLVFVGDLIDRGPAPNEVVRFVRDLQRSGDVQVVLGNHEEKAVRWLRRAAEERATGKKNPMRRPPPERLAQWESLQEADVTWLQALPAIVTPISGWLAVHAGFEATPREDQRTDKLIRVRWIDPGTGKMVGFKEDSLDQPEGTIYWSERWRGPENVVYGHAVHSRSTPRVDRHGEVECWGIDTGVCFGGRLTAFCLETREITQVEARAVYADPKVELND